MSSQHSGSQQPASRSASRSVSQPQDMEKEGGSKQGSRSPSNSLERREHEGGELGAPPAPHLPPNEVANESGEPADPNASLFVGFGPGGSRVTREQLTARLSEVPNVTVRAMRLRGRCAFVDLGSPEEVAACIAAVNGTELNGTLLKAEVAKARGVMREEREKKRDEKKRERDVKREPPVRGRGAAGSADRIRLFIGLGPNANTVSDELLARTIEKRAKFIDLRRKHQCVFVDFATREDADRVRRELHGEYLESCRLVVQYSKDNARSLGEPRGRDVERHGRDRRRDDSYDRRGDRRGDRRDRSPDRRRHRSRRDRHSRRSRTPSSRSYSSRSYSRSTRSRSRSPVGGKRGGGGRRRSLGSASWSSSNGSSRRHARKRR